MNSDEDAGHRDVEMALSFVFFLLAATAAVCGMLRLIERDWFMAIYLFAAGCLSVAAGCNPVNAVRLAVGKVTTRKSHLSYAKLAMPFLALAVILGLVAGIVQHLTR